MRITWLPPSRNIKSASLRIRVIEIMKNLRALGHECSFYNDAVYADILIISKKYDFETRKIMSNFRLRNKNGLIIFDLCDNHFYTDSTIPKYFNKNLERVNELKKTIEMSDAITTSSDYLAAVVVENCNVDKGSVFAIEDCYENLQKYSFSKKILNIFAELSLWRLKKRLSSSNNIPGRLVWFGTHGVSYAEGGMSDLLEIKTLLSDPIVLRNGSLTIISNSFSKYRKIAKNFKVRTYYLPWNQYTINRALQLHSILLLPIKHSPFTLSKSANRPVTAILNKLLVVCDMIPAYDNLAKHIISPIDATALKYALTLSSSETNDRLQSALNFINSEYSPKQIALKWEAIFLNVINKKSI
jgi:hypothetical protein